MTHHREPSENSGGSPAFESGFQTEWNVVHCAGRDTPDAGPALERLCHTYWYPLYAYVRRQGYSPADAQDLTQEFFSRLLARPAFHDLHPSKGRFRSFLLAALNHFLANEWRRNHTQKRGGDTVTFSIDGAAAEGCLQLEPAHHESPDRLFDRHWALSALHRARTKLERECAAEGKAALFTELRGMLDGDPQPVSYRDVAQRLNLSEDAVKKAAQRLRERYQGAIRAEIAETVPSPFEVEDELRQLLAALGT